MQEKSTFLFKEKNNKKNKKTATYTCVVVFAKKIFSRL